QLGKGQPVTGEFKTLLPTVNNSNTFSSVTVLTRGLEPGEPEHSELIDGQINAVAKHIFQEGGAVQKYNSATGKWQSVAPEGNDWIFSNAVPSPQYGKPLVLLANWVDEIQPHKLYNSGFAEAAADVLFASMVQLDLEKGGSIGKEGKLYDSTGKLIRNQGAVFNSPLHFVGFGQGAVVNSEIVQRLGTFLPDAGGTSRANRDLQMTTIDPYDYDANSFDGTYLNILDPEIKVWNNVTYADNYYQTKGSGNTINGRELSGTNWKSDWNVSLNNLAGFTPDDGEGASHRDALAWYAGTANLNESRLPSENGETIYRRLGDLAENNITDPTKTWYTPDHTNASFTQGNEKAPWEGIGTGWFDSVLGGGSQLRPYFDGGKKKKNELGNFEDYLKNNRVSVYEDNTYTDITKPFGTRMRGDYAVPTLFNGNFDAVAAKLDSQPIPGWSLYNGDDESVLQKSLVNRNSISSLSDPVVGSNSGQPNYALKLNSGESITHNSFVVPDWGVLRLDLHVPESSLNKGGRLKVYLEEVGSLENVKIGEISLKSANPQKEKATRTSLTVRNAADETRQPYDVSIPADYGYDKDTIGYGSSGFETFHIDVPPSLRGKVAKLTFELQGAEPVYIDNAFFKSEVLKWGNPTEARNDLQFENNFLIEKPQYTLSYNRSKNTVNWVGWKLDKTWLGTVKRPQFFGFAQDPELAKTGWYSVKDSDYDALSLKDKDGQVVDNRKGDRYADGYVDFEIKENGNYIPILGIDRGHLAPAADRSRTAKDLYATFLTTNLLPQQSSNNRGIWETIEGQIRSVINSPDSSGLETYMFAGGYGYYDNPSQRPYTGISQNSNLDPLIQFPVGLWKVVMTKDKNTELPQYAHYGIYLGNDERIGYQKQTIQNLEDLLNGDLPDISPQYQFLSNLPESVGKERIKNTIFERLP
ncbi:DNA/RNA non-specific endonuclease, partial [Microcoleus sp. T3_D1]|uniref:DNA/RNA non-specific endonuclease n=1 Tax=Microcoleus sp. T3_D1 TaxID=3055427 RepID=UPI002FCF6039